MKQKSIIIAAILFIIVSLIYLLNGHSPKDLNSKNPNFITNFSNGQVKIGGDFTLTKHDSSKFQFSSLNGKPTLIYFGFTHCPDFCPTSLQVMDAVAEQIDVNRVFVSIDPERDTTEVLENYVELYKKGLIGLTGSLQETDKVAKQWYIYYAFNKAHENDQNYIVDHTTYLYLSDKTGNVFALIRPEATPNEIVKFIQTYLN